MTSDAVDFHCWMLFGYTLMMTTHTHRVIIPYFRRAEHVRQCSWGYRTFGLYKSSWVPDIHSPVTHEIALEWVRSYMDVLNHERALVRKTLTKRDHARFQLLTERITVYEDKHWPMPSDPTPTGASPDAR